MNIIPQVQSYTCPCCQGFIGEAAPLDAVAKQIGGNRLLILKFLASRVGAQTSRDEIEAHLYGGRKDGGPVRSRAVVHVEIGRLRKAIAPFGWTIVGGNGAGSRSLYRLIPTETGQ